MFCNVTQVTHWSPSPKNADFPSFGHNLKQKNLQTVFFL